MLENRHTVIPIMPITIHGLHQWRFNATLCTLSIFLLITDRFHFIPSAITPYLTSLRAIHNMHFFLFLARDSRPDRDNMRLDLHFVDGACMGSGYDGWGIDRLEVGDWDFVVGEELGRDYCEGFHQKRSKGFYLFIYYRCFWGLLWVLFAINFSSSYRIIPSKIEIPDK